MNDRIRKPTKVEAFSTLIVMILSLAIGQIFGVNVASTLVISTTYAIVIGKRCGYSWTELSKSMYDKVASLLEVMFLLLGIGYLIASWMYSGTIPVLIYYLLDLVNPNLCILLAFILTAVISEAIGTSYGAAGTIGVVMLGLGTALGVNLPALAGAVICGAHVGQLISPMADMVVLASSVGKTDTISFIKRSLYFTVPMLAICVVFFGVLGFGSGTEQMAVDSVQIMKEQISNIYSKNLLVLIPFIFLVIAVFKKMNVTVAMFISGFLSIIVGWLVQGFTLSSGLTAVYSGFNLTNVTGIAAEDVLPQMITLLNRGGMTSWGSTFILLFVAMGFAGVMMKISALEVIVETLFSRVKSTIGLSISTVLIGFITAASTSSSYITLLMPVDLLGDSYEKNGYHRVNVAAISNTVGTMVMVLFPWTANAVYFSGVTGVSTLEAMPYVILNWGTCLMAIATAFFKFGFVKLEKKNSI